MNPPEQLLSIGFITAMCTERALAAVKVADGIDTELHPELRDVAEELHANAHAFYAIAVYYRAQNTTAAKQPPMVERYEQIIEDRTRAHGARSAAGRTGNGGAR